MATRCPTSFLFLILAAASLTACTWVKTEPGADRVELASPEATMQCQRLGLTTATVRDRVAGVQRRAERVADELADLARNSAVELGGDTIVADGPVEDGQRRFIVYRCRR